MMPSRRGTPRDGGRLTTAAWTATSATPPPFAPVTARGGLVFVRGSCPQRPLRRTCDSGRPGARRLKARLERAGTSIDRVVSTSVYLADAGDFASLNAVWAKHWPASPPARTTVVAKLPVAGARIQVSAVAAAAAPRAPSSCRRDGPRRRPFSHAVRAGDMLFLSGQVPRRGADNTLVTGDIEAQTHAVFENAGAILRRRG